MRLVEPYNGDQASDSILNIQVPGASAGDCVTRFTVDSSHKWEIRLDNDANDELQFQYNGTVTALTLGTGGGGTFASINLTASKGTGTFTPVLGSLSPASTLQPSWLPWFNGTVAGYIPFFPA